MKSFYPSYIRAYKKFVQAAFDNGGFYQSMSQFAIIISEYANELTKRATLNSRVDFEKLSKEMVRIGTVYVRKYGDMERRK